MSPKVFFAKTSFPVTRSSLFSGGKGPVYPFSLPPEAQVSLAPSLALLSLKLLYSHALSELPCFTVKTFQKSDFLVSGALDPETGSTAVPVILGLSGAFSQVLIRTCILTKTEGGCCREPVSVWNAPSTCPSADPFQL